MKKSKRNLTETRKTILNSAFWEFYTRGFANVSIDQIVATTPLTKGAFYHQFPTKNDLGYALVDEVLTNMIIERWIEPLNNYENPLKGTLDLVHQHYYQNIEIIVQYGCPLNNMAQETSPLNDIFKEKISNALNFWINETQKHIKRAQKNNIINDKLNSKEIAEFIIMSLEGFAGILKGTGNKKVYKSLYRGLRGYFNTISNVPL